MAALAVSASTTGACTTGDVGNSADASSGDASSGQGTDASSEADASAVAGSEGCTDGQGLAEGEHSFTLDGMERRYRIYLPTGYTRDTAWPLLLALHPNGSNIDYWDVTDGERDVRGEVAADAILVVTEAIGGNWRDYDQDPSTWAARLEIELMYFDQIVADVGNALCVNESQVFSMGFSGGGSFSGVLGCRRGYIRAFAGGGAVEYFDRADCVQAPPAWITIGELELAPGREDFRDYFRDSAGCDATSTAVEPSPCVAYDNCDSATPVQYCEHPGDHIWPNFGTAATWTFLKSFTE